MHHLTKTLSLDGPDTVQYPADKFQKNCEKVFIEKKKKTNGKPINKNMQRFVELHENDKRVGSTFSSALFLFLFILLLPKRLTETLEFLFFVVIFFEEAIVSAIYELH